MNNVIPITHSKCEIISIRPRTSTLSPLKTREANQNNLVQLHKSMKLPSMTHSYICKIENNESMIENSSKKKIVLKKHTNYKQNNRHHCFQNQKSYYVSLLGQTHNKARKQSKHLHIEIDLDKIRSQNKTYEKAALENDRNQSQNLPSKSLKYQTRITNLTAIPIEKQQETRQTDHIFSKVTLKLTHKKSARRKNSSRQIKESIFKSSEKQNRKYYRPKSLDTILRIPNVQNLRGQDEIDNRTQLKKQSNAVLSILTQEQALKNLFKKLTKKNLPYENWINYINLTYEQLTMDELHFIGILLQRVQPKYLNAMDYLTFKFKIYQTCQKEFQELMHFQQINK